MAIRNQQSVNLVFPHQLFKDPVWIKNQFPTLLVEEHLFFKQYLFHKQKIAYHRASMKSYAAYLTSLDLAVTYINAQDDRSDVRSLINWLKEQKIKEIHIYDPVDNWLETRIRHAAGQSGIKIIMYESNLFINSREELKVFFKPGK